MNEEMRMIGRSLIVWLVFVPGLVAAPAPVFREARGKSHLPGKVDGVEFEVIGWGSNGVSGTLVAKDVSTDNLPHYLLDCPEGVFVNDLLVIKLRVRVWGKRSSIIDLGTWGNCPRIAVEHFQILRKAD
jgi:hypothetical protein